MLCVTHYLFVVCGYYPIHCVCMYIVLLRCTGAVDSGSLCSFYCRVVLLLLYR